MQFKRNIRFIGLMMTAIGGIVGSGWLFGPFYAAKAAGPASIIAWLLGGSLMIIIALTFAELATLFPVAGGTVRFAQFSHGRFVSFTMAWISWLAAVIVAPIETMASLQYLANYFPSLAHSTSGVTHLTALGIAVAALIMLFMCFFNKIGVRFFTKTNNVIVFWKLLIPVAAVFILLSSRFHWQHFVAYGGFAPYGLKGIVHSLPTAGIIFSFIGYSPAIQLAAEARNPNKAIPYAIVIAIGLCVLLYMAIEFAFIGAAPTDSLLRGWGLMHFAGDAGPVAGIVMALGLFWFVKLLYLDAVISPIGTAYIYTASTSRINYAMSENGYMPKIMKHLNKQGVPFVAIITNFVVGMIFFLPFPGWQTMVSFLVSCFVVAYAVGPIACLSLRYSLPKETRPFRLPFVRLTTLLAFYICNLIIYWTGWTTIWRMLIVIFLGYIFLFLYQVVQKRDKRLVLNVSRAYWLFPYFIGLAIISFLGAFGGGKELIRFGWDFLVLFVFSGIIFYWAILSRQDETTVKRLFETQKMLEPSNQSIEVVKG
jgi:amino acid transporter